MCQANLIPETDTVTMPLNMPNPSRWQPKNRLRPQTATASPQSTVLNRHPRWPYFLAELDEIILSQAPNLRETFLELLDRIDRV